MARTGFRARCDSGGVLLNADHLLRGIDLDQIGLLAGLQKHAVQVGTVDEAIRIAEAVEEFLVERQAGDEFPGGGIAHRQIVGERGKPVDLLGHAEQIEHAEEIRSELDARADFLQFRGLFQYLRGDALA
jgi:hypothetical protein